ncbi:hypothetical protein NE236_15015 [Actinoallomurus purpureus]|uniref:WXG100 family type VII secretion target n=1 Tax=Actinoallomurus purpureus TaxID=478114 RepID=UPI002093E0F3|nr:hypothetical protein [Actinoallomurus purpureus]MCO6006300.1 hypothetical protein [Actinoallomurus purpureus]
MAESFPGPVSAAISLAYKINPSLGGAVEQNMKGLWGDPPSIRESALQWTKLGVDVDNSTKSIKNAIKVLGEHWEGQAKDAYVNWMQTLNEDSIAVIGNQFKKISGILTSVADDVNAMNGELTQLCTWFVGVVGGILFKNMAGKAEAAAAATMFLDKLSEFNTSYINKLAPRVAEISQIDAEIGEGVIGRMVQHVPDMNHPFPYQVRQFADSYKWNIMGDWRKWNYTK